MEGIRMRDASRLKPGIWIFIVALIAVSSPQRMAAQAEDITGKLQGFDSYMEKILKDWNAPGVGVGIVVKD
jgi:hypothetical protein